MRFLITCIKLILKQPIVVLKAISELKRKLMDHQRFTTYTSMTLYQKQSLLMMKKKKKEIKHKSKVLMGQETVKMKAVPVTVVTLVHNGNTMIQLANKFFKKRMKSSVTRLNSVILVLMGL